MIPPSVILHENVISMTIMFFNTKTIEKDRLFYMYNKLILFSIFYILGIDYLEAGLENHDNICDKTCGNSLEHPKQLLLIVGDGVGGGGVYAIRSIHSASLEL